MTLQTPTSKLQRSSNPKASIEPRARHHRLSNLVRICCEGRNARCEYVGGWNLVFLGSLGLGMWNSASPA
jgi:hypothetical protein